MLGRAFFFVGAARSDQLKFGPRPLARTDDLITIGGRALVGDGLADTRLGLEDDRLLALCSLPGLPSFVPGPRLSHAGAPRDIHD